MNSVRFNRGEINDSPTLVLLAGQGKGRSAERPLHGTKNGTMNARFPAFSSGFRRRVFRLPGSHRPQLSNVSLPVLSPNCARTTPNGAAHFLSGYAGLRSWGGNKVHRLQPADHGRELRGDFALRQGARVIRIDTAERVPLIVTRKRTDVGKRIPKLPRGGEHR